MKRIKLTIAYDGTNYVGWQIQKNGLAVEQVINEHLSRLLKENIVIIGASRTDSGVHARGNVAIFDTDTRIPAEKISYALNQSLPDDIRITRSEEVPAEFHPRYANCRKTYQYNILNCRYNIPTLRLYNDYVYYYLDEGKMRRAAEYLIGEHDFTAFSSSGGQQKTTVRTIYGITITTEPIAGLPQTATADSLQMPGENADVDGQPCMATTTDSSGQNNRNYCPKVVHIEVCGNGFLYNMVRIIAGTLEKVGMGIYPPEHVKEILDSCDRRLSAPKASARGLTLMGIDYLDLQGH